MLWSGFPGLAQLGLFSIAGLLAALLVTRFVLPELARQTSSHGLRKGLRGVRYCWRAWRRACACRRCCWVIAAAVWLALRGGPVWDDQLAS